MTELETWLNLATRRLSKESAARVRAEIGEHYESAREAALRTGAGPAEAERMAMAALGDAKTANCQYRKVLLTSGEARMLRQGNREAQAVCSSVAIKGALLAVSLAALCGAIAFFRAGVISVAQNLALFAGWVAINLLACTPFLPVYTPSRARVFRIVKWVFILATLEHVFHRSTLFFACLWLFAWAGWTRASIRRKLPVAEWPRQLYL